MEHWSSDAGGNHRWISDMEFRRSRFGREIAFLVAESGGKKRRDEEDYQEKGG